MQIETTLQSDPDIEVVVAFRYIPRQPMCSDCPPADEEIEFYSIKVDGVDASGLMKKGDLEALEIECFDYVKELKLEEQIQNVNY